MSHRITIPYLRQPLVVQFTQGGSWSWGCYYCTAHASMHQSELEARGRATLHMRGVHS